MDENTAKDNFKTSAKKPRAKKLSTHIDMTPMVDLACLLITFFMLTAAMTKSRALEIMMPKAPEHGDNNTTVIKDRAMHILLTNNDKIYWYIGKDDKTARLKLFESGFNRDGIRKVLIEKNLPVIVKIEELNRNLSESKMKYSEEAILRAIRNIKSDDKVGPVVFNKADEDVKYKNIVDIIDEMAITNIARYTMAEMTTMEKGLLAENKIKVQSVGKY